MNMIERVEHWGDAHHPGWWDVLRILLGIVIFLKGVTFLADTESLRQLIEQVNVRIYAWGAVHYIAFAHLVGGILIALGLLTRVAIGFQLPVLIGAVFFVNVTRGLSVLNSELWISLVVLVLLVVFFVIGSGPYSLDQQMRERRA